MLAPRGLKQGRHLSAHSVHAAVVGASEAVPIPVEAAVGACWLQRPADHILCLRVTPHLLLYQRVVARCAIYKHVRYIAASEFACSAEAMLTTRCRLAGDDEHTRCGGRAACASPPLGLEVRSKILTTAKAIREPLIEADQARYL